MDTSERFDQLESLLVDLARKVDRQGEQIAQIITILNQQGEAIVGQGGAIAGQGDAILRQEKRLDAIGEQIGDSINILKISEARHTETERHQDAVMAEIKQQGQRQDVAVDALRALLNRQETTDSRLDSAVQTQLQMLQLMRLTSEKTNDLVQRLPPVEGQEPRIKRLEDEVFRAAS